MSRRLTTEEFIEKSRQVHGDKYDYSKSIYVRSHDKIDIVCPKHGIFRQLAQAHMSGNGCPGCQKEWSETHKKNHIKSVRSSLGYNTDIFIKKAKEVHGNKYDYSQVVYVNSKTKVKIICDKHGIFEQTPDSHLRGTNCPICGQLNKRQFDHRWSDAQREKIKETCLKRYSAKRYLDSDEGKLKIKDIKSKPEFREKMRNKILSKDVQNKTIRTCLKRYGVKSPMELEYIKDKVYQTKKRNHTVNTSKGEAKVYDCLCGVFGEFDVAHQYNDKERYPFACDFYIRSLDLFIELNLHWSHGHHWFGSEINDNNILSNWKTKALTSDYYKVAIIVWTIRDLEKRKSAIYNNLNYLVFWKSDLSDFYYWLDCYKNGKLILNNIK